MTMNKSHRLFEALTPLIAGQQVVPVTRPRYLAQTKPTLSQAMQVIRTVEANRSWDSSNCLTTHPTVGKDARKDYYDPDPLERWHPEFKDEFNAKRNSNTVVQETDNAEATARSEQILGLIEAARRNNKNGNGSRLNKQAADSQRGIGNSDEPDEKTQDDPRGAGPDPETQGDQGAEQPDGGEGEPVGGQAPPEEDPEAPPMGDPRRDPTTGGFLPPEGSGPPEEKPGDPRKDPSKAKKALTGADKAVIDQKRDAVIGRYNMEKDPLGGGPRNMNIFQKREMIKGKRQKPKQGSGSAGRQGTGEISKYWG